MRPELYQKAIQSFNQLKNERGVAIAKFYWIREEKRINNNVPELIDQVIRSAKKLGLNELLQSKVLNN